MSTPATRTPAATSAPPSPGWDVAALVVLQAALLVGFPRALDLHVADEFWYQRQGADLLRGEASPVVLAYGPVFSCFYALLQCLPLPRTSYQDAMSVVVSIALSTSLWWCVRPVVARPAALAVAAWAAASTFVIGSPELWTRANAYGFNACLCFVAVGLAARRAPVAALAVLAAAALNRKEILPWLAAAAVATCWLGRRRRDRRLVVGGAVGIATAIAIASIVLAVPESKERAWIVFAYEYATETVGPGNVALDPVARAKLAADPGTAVQQHFPGCDSVWSAAWSEPGRFAEHVGKSLTRLPASIGLLVGTPFAHRPALRFALLAVAGALVVLGIRRARRRFRRTPRRPPELPTELRVVLWASPLVLVPVLISGPWLTRILPLVPLIAIGCGRFGSLGARAVRATVRRCTARADAAPYASTGAVAVVLAAAMLPGPFASVPGRPLVARELQAVLGDAGLEAGDTIATSQWAEFVWSVGDGLRRVPLSNVVSADWLAVSSDDVALFGAELGAVLDVATGPGWSLDAVGADVWLFRRSTPR